jgi:hypothetical protein
VTTAPQPFFDQIGITKVVWFDDLFEVKTTPTQIAIVDRVATARAAGMAIQDPKLADLSGEDSPQEWARQIQSRMTESEIIEFLARIEPPEPQEPVSKPSDYGADELKEVVLSLGSNVQCLGLTRWSELKENLIANAGSDVFLVDRERMEGSELSNVGDGIVKELIDRCPVDAVVMILTHSVGPDGTEELRQTLATELNVPIARLGVVSKRPVDTSLTNGIRAAVRVTLTQLTCSVVADRMVAAMTTALADTKKALNELPVSALDQAIFENSFTEGASEIDVLCRILLSRQRTAIDADIAGALDQVHSPLARMRKLRLLEALPALPVEEADLLKQWRRDEVFDPGERLNALRSPLACGDVFLKDGTQRYYVLLGQPCDLMVRPDGQRSANEGVFVKLTTSYTPTPASEGRFFEVPPLAGTTRWAVDFREWSSVNLDWLEWTSFNNDGRVAFSPAVSSPIGLLPGWEIRYDRSRRKFEKGRQYCLSLGKKLAGSVATASATTVEFPYKRVARLRAPRAAAAYASFVGFQARGAFDHDFAKGIDKKSEQVAPSPSDKS